MNAKKNNIKAAIENNPVVFFLGALLLGFLSGFGAYKTIIETARLDIVSKHEVSNLKNEIKKLKAANGNLLTQNERIAVAIQKCENEKDRFEQRLILLSDKNDYKFKGLESQSSSVRQPSPGKFYNVILHLPSHMEKSEIFVDGFPAAIVKDRTLLVTIQVPEKTEPIEIIVKKGDKVCSIKKLIDANNEKLYPCRR